MKIAVVFLVVAISSCYTVDALDLGQNVIPDVVGKCVIGTLEESGFLLLQLRIILCTFQHGQDQMNDEKWNQLYESLKNVVDQIGCELSTALGIQVLEDAGEPAKEIVKKIVEPIRLLLENSGLAAPAYQEICLVMKNLIDRGCLPQILAGDVTKLLIDMETRACPDRNGEIVVEDIRQILQRLPCLLGDKTLDEVLAGIFIDDSGALHISEAADEVLGHIILILCPLVEILFPTPSS